MNFLRQHSTTKKMNRKKIISVWHTVTDGYFSGMNLVHFLLLQDGRTTTRNQTTEIGPQVGSLQATPAKTFASTEENMVGAK